MNLTQTSGFLVVDIIAQGPADKAGLRGGFAISNINGTEVELGGDVITGIDNTTVRKIDDILSYFDTKNIGDIVILKVLRDNKAEDIAVTLGPHQNSDPNLSSSPDLNIPRPSPEPPGSSDDPMKDFYNSCANMAGEDLCNRLFGGGK
jgi:serine protease Do